MAAKPLAALWFGIVAEYPVHNPAVLHAMTAGIDDRRVRFRRPRRKRRQFPPHQFAAAIKHQIQEGGTYLQRMKLGGRGA